VNWTTEQQEVIRLRGKNLLVSAAAGSGKTAVLVEHIITMITREEAPVDIDRLLIVTFTNAAAAEMRERIGKAIDEKLNDMPENSHLQKQATLIHSAQITTIHSFCLQVIRNHFNTIDLDPSFRIAEEAELTLLKSDIIGELLEEYYEEGREDFFDFIESFSTGKADGGIEELIIKLYEFSMSYPWPGEWLYENQKLFSLESVEDMKETAWMKLLLDFLHRILGDLLLRLQEAIEVCEEGDGPLAYLSALESDRTQLKALSLLEDYEEYYEALKVFSFARLSGKKQEGVSEEKKNQVKAIREEIKKAVGDMNKNYFFQPAKEMLLDLQAMKSSMDVLVELCFEFGKKYADRKAEKNIVDFNDLEHFALKVLVNKEEGLAIPTAAAIELSEHYEEIMIDEYQDSNLVQETILSSISGERSGRYNRFMVGDVKQSIYKFRLARPEIFMEKFKTYPTALINAEESKKGSIDEKELLTGAVIADREKEEVTDIGLEQCCRIDLHKNFRSREVVLNSINFIFEQIMDKKLGNITYDKQAALYPGADFGELKEGVSSDTELLLIETEPREGLQEELRNIYDADKENPYKDSDEEEDYTARELEAKAIAKRMRELTDPDTGLLLYEAKRKEYRRATLGDIVILLRTMSGWAEVIADTLAAEGIASHTETRSGYFSTLEIRTVLNLLRIIDNPRQDIPFTAILRSPVVKVTTDELAAIRIPKRKITMYEAAVSYAEEQEDELAVKLSGFLNKLNQYRKLVIHLPIHELISKVLEDTGYYQYASAMPAGEKRQANIDMLIERAVRFESTSYSGLFHFVRYMEKLHKYDVDFGEAKLAGEGDNTVKIMSIHKSKGLEFPIVFVAGMGKSFNNQDSRSKLLIHPDLGIGPDYINHQLRVKAPTLIKKVMQKQVVLENLGEELRVLYVALTRAKEKLIMTGGVKDINKLIDKYSVITKRKEEKHTFYQLSSAGTYLDWIVPALLRHPCFEELLRERGIRQNDKHSFYQNAAAFSVRIYTYEDLARSEYKEQADKLIRSDMLFNWDDHIVYNEEVREAIRTRLEFLYPYQNETNIHTKVTVSELKKLGQMEAEDLSVPLRGLEKKMSDYPVPEFLKATEAAVGADLGTLYHKVLELMDFKESYTKESMEKYLHGLVAGGKLRAEDLEVIEVNNLLAFTGSVLAERLKKAAKAGTLHKESQFVMGMKACEINTNMSSNEVVLIQGIIDVYFEEDGELILLDYKTDNLQGRSGEKLLISRYKVQMDYYVRALEQLTGKRVAERLIYSFGLSKVIQI
jgi:ATP-dependent helicase/nuclease subunit A